MSEPNLPREKLDYAFCLMFNLSLTSDVQVPKRLATQKNEIVESCSNSDLDYYVRFLANPFVKYMTPSLPPSS